METMLTLMLLGLYGFIAVLLYKIVKVEQKISSAAKKVEFDPMITLWKFFKQLILGGVSFGLIELTTNFSTILQQWKPVGMVFLIATFNAIINYLKYR
jgi:apolipoprotein N-acyltransferase